MNDYAATAVAEKRLREVLAARLPHPTDADMLADILLSGEIGIEYKPRLKAVFITIPVPEKAAAKNVKAPETGLVLAEPPGNDVADAPPWTTDDDARAMLAAGAERAEAVAQQAVAALGTDIPCPPFEDVQLQVTKATGACGSPVPCIVTFVPKAEPDDGYDDTSSIG